MPFDDDFPAQLEVTITHKGKVLGSAKKGINDDIFGFKRERAFQLGHMCGQVAEKAVADACKNFDATNEES